MDPLEIIETEKKRHDLQARWSEYAQYQDSIDKAEGNQKQLPITAANKKIQDIVFPIFHKA